MVKQTFFFSSELLSRIVRALLSLSWLLSGALLSLSTPTYGRVAIYLLVVGLKDILHPVNLYTNSQCVVSQLGLYVSLQQAVPLLYQNGALYRWVTMKDQSLCTWDQYHNFCHELYPQVKHHIVGMPRWWNKYFVSWLVSPSSKKDKSVPRFLYFLRRTVNSLLFMEGVQWNNDPPSNWLVHPRDDRNWDLALASGVVAWTLIGEGNWVHLGVLIMYFYVTNHSKV